MLYEMIRRRYNICEADFKGRFVPRIVFVNKSDVDRYSILDNRISFVLKPTTKGVDYEYTSKMLDILGNFENVKKNGGYYYKHNVQAPLGGLINSNFLIELNNSKYFAALLDLKGYVHIFGFDFGLKTEEDLYNAHILNVISLSSLDSGLETKPPFVYYSLDAEKDFFDNFENNTLIESGDFNDDFNNDYFK